MRPSDLAIMLCSLICEMRKDPTFWFTHPRAGKQQSEHEENEFGGDCMLGKLCRLVKHCGQQLATKSAAIHQCQRTFLEQTRDLGKA